MTDYKRLMTRANEMRAFSHVPYSHYRVGAVLVGKSGKEYTGCNLENAAYSPSICAERTAIGNAVSSGAREFLKIAIVGGKNGEIADYCPPCGICRQVLSELCGEDFKILLYNGKDIKSYRLSELLPLVFGREELC